jgi:hypothetical protein
MRDLRRYASPVIVENAGQVNIASNGGQQVNVQWKEIHQQRSADFLNEPDDILRLYIL